MHLHTLDQSNVSFWKASAAVDALVKYYEKTNKNYSPMT